MLELLMSIIAIISTPTSVETKPPVHEFYTPEITIPIHPESFPQSYVLGEPEVPMCATDFCYTVDSFEIIQEVETNGGTLERWVECYNTKNVTSPEEIELAGFTYDFFMNNTNEVIKTICE